MDLDPRDVNAFDRGFGKCPHCFDIVIVSCHECGVTDHRSRAGDNGWRMDHLSGFGCIALCRECRSDDTETPRLPAVDAPQPLTPSVGGTGSRTGGLKTQRGAEAADIEHGRQIAMTAMDLAEARYRHEHGQPHRREHCETCAREAVADAAKPGHLREAAASLRAIADHMPDTSSAAELRPGIHYAATLIGHTADDLTEGETS
jgi:hypothetical protein